jgi:aminomethyltransferase
MKQTALHDLHVESGARMVEFAGYDMPVMYESIVAEHQWTRSAVGLFDVSHMGRVRLSGAGSAELVDRLGTARPSAAPIGRTTYTLFCNDAGGIMDDIMISKLADDAFYVVCNAGNHEKIAAHIQQHRGGVACEDLTDRTMMLALQGPKTVAMLAKFLPTEVLELPHRSVYQANLFGLDFVAFRGGYTGEDGFEVVLDANAAGLLWPALTTATMDGERVIKPCGLGARDTLRLEAALPLYGHEMDESVDPYSAGLSFAVDLDHEFIGRDALKKLSTSATRTRVGLKLTGKKAARQGYAVLAGDANVGVVTSGAFCPTVDASVAMAIIAKDHAAVGTTLSVDTGRSRESATVVKLPFYRRAKA